MDFETLAYGFVKDLCGFDYALSCRDHVWDILFPDQAAQWHRLHVTRYERVFYIAHVNGGDQILHIEPGKTVMPADFTGRPLDSREWNKDDRDHVWSLLITSVRRWMKAARKDWMAAARRVQADYPLGYRYGIAPNALVRASLPDAYRLDKELGKTKTRKLISLVEGGFFMTEENTTVATMTAEDYFNYCRIAYLAGQRKGEALDASLSGREMYARYADGRHEGILDIDPKSEEEFGDWIDGTHPKREGGGHPWEIKRGGNTTHIDLSVSRPSHYCKEGFRVELRGESIGRMVETMRMFLAIHEAGLPIAIANPESVRKRLLAQDNIGLMPDYAHLHRANQRFPRHQDVFDVMHYKDLGRFKRRITPFITWEPLPILRPRE